MSGLILPPGYQQKPEPKLPAAFNPRSAPSENFEPYYSEIPKITEVTNKLNRIFAWSGEEPWTERQFETAARNMFGEIGFEITIEWMQAMDPDTGEELDFKAPSVAISGRVEKEEQRDHDRLKHEIVTGQADGQAGYIREDGSRHEDPKRKLIT